VDGESEDFTAWTAEGAARLRAAGAELAAAVTAHASAVAAATGREEFVQVVAASDRLLPAVLGYADAQFDHTGTAFPFGVLHEYAEQGDDDDDGQDRPEAGAAG
jgi:hypothetical protein